jgi:tRNA threonylcarbamoyladenosine biosynthesis protein TsaB
VKLLALDTATELCSAALWIDGRLATREEARPRAHGERILPMIEELLAEAQIRLQQLDAIAFGRGPGAFTGVRLAVSVAQGLGFSAGLPLIPVSDLRALAARALYLPAVPARALICQDARMHEVYWGCFERADCGICAVGAEAVAAPSAVVLPDIWRGSATCGAGSGFAAYRAPLAGIVAGLSQVFETLLPRAAEIARIAADDGIQQAVLPEHAQPVYLRDEVAVPAAATNLPRS